MKSPLQGNNTRSGTSDELQGASTYEHEDPKSSVIKAASCFPTTGNETISASALVTRKGAEAPDCIIARSRAAYELWRGALKKVTDGLSPSCLRIIIELNEVQSKAIECLNANTLATFGVVTALNGAKSEDAASQIERSRRQHEALNEQIVTFFATAQNAIDTLTFSLTEHFQELSKVAIATVVNDQKNDALMRLKDLTVRQKCVLELLAKGKPNKVIAYELSICESTVKAHVSEILRKLGVSSRVRALVVLASIDLNAFLSVGSGFDPHAGHTD